MAWWRDEVVRSIDWGGDPLNAKLAELEGDTVRLSPRRSFERWRQLVSGRAAPWTPAQKGAARRFARHIGSAMLRQERAAAVVADDLQRTLLPSSLPRPDGWDLTAFYEPAAGGRVGGDWYDAVVLPDGHAYVVLGDITGHGTAAAAEMAQVRNAFRALLVESATPQEALERLDRFVLTLLPGSLATIACARIELATGEVVLSHAGHLPALHLTATGAEFAALARDTLIGVRHVPRKATTLRLAPGVLRLLPEQADPYFRAERVGDGATLAPGFSVLLVTDGELALTTEAGQVTRVHAGETYLLPFATGTCRVAGTGSAVRCRPPDPALGAS